MIRGSRADFQPQVVAENKTGTTVRLDIGGKCTVITIIMMHLDHLPLHGMLKENGGHSDYESDSNMVSLKSASQLMYL